MKPPIPEKELASLLAVARLPTKSLPAPDRLPVWCAVATMKGRIGAEASSPSTQWEGKNLAVWQRLRDALDEALERRDFAAFDEFAEAWGKSKGPAAVVRFKMKCGDQQIVGSTFDGFAHTPRKKITVKIIDAIQQIQRRENRAPMASEILSYMEDGMEDAELSSQLKEMGLQGRMNKRADLAS